MSDFNAYNLGIPLYSREDLDVYNSFFRVSPIDPYTNFGNTVEYIFVTKPDLPILDSDGSLSAQFRNIPIFYDVNRNYPGLLEQLSNVGGQPSPFMNILTTYINKSSGVDLNSIESTEVSTSATMYGDNMTYRGMSVESDNNQEFSAEFRDDMSKRVYTIFKLWDKYTNLKLDGSIGVPEDKILKKEIEDQVCVYKIVVSAIDMSTILFFSKWWGVYPKRVPRDAFSQPIEDGQLRLNMSFQSQWVDDSDPEIITDFNDLVDPYAGGMERLSNFNGYTQGFDMSRAKIPYIEYEESNIKMPGSNGMSYKLTWRG